MSDVLEKDVTAQNSFAAVAASSPSEVGAALVVRRVVGLMEANDMNVMDPGQRATAFNDVVQVLGIVGQGELKTYEVSDFPDREQRALNKAQVFLGLN